MENRMHESPETKAIRQRMDEVRCDLDEDVQEIVEGARDLGKWRSYVKSYPWVCLGAALAVGYVIVPRPRFSLRSHTENLAELASQSRLLAMSNMPAKGNSPGILMRFVGNLVMRGVTSYVGQQADKLFAAQATQSQQDESS